MSNHSWNFMENWTKYFSFGKCWFVTLFGCLFAQIFAFILTDHVPADWQVIFQTHSVWAFSKWKCFQMTMKKESTVFFVPLPITWNDGISSWWLCQFTALRHQQWNSLCFSINSQNVYPWLTEANQSNFVRITDRYCTICRVNNSILSFTCTQCTSSNEC